MANPGHSSVGALRPGFTRLPDGRGRMVVAVEKLSSGEQFRADLRLAKGVLYSSAERVDCSVARLAHLAALRLVDDGAQQSGDGWHWVRTYEDIHATDETLAGRARVLREPSGRIVVEQDWLQFSSAKATPQQVDVTACAVWPVAISAIVGTASGDVFTLAGHGLLAGDRVRFTALTGGAGLATGTDYYVRDVTAATFKLAASLVGAAVNFTTDVTAATLLFQGDAILGEEDAPDDGTLRRIRRRYYHAPTVATRLGGARLVFPFAAEGDLVTAEIQQDYYIRADSYVAPTLSTVYAGEARLAVQPSGTFYLVGDSRPSPLPGASVAFTRVWSMIPAARTRAEGTVPWKRVGLLAGGPTGAPVALTAMSWGTPPVFTSTGAHGLSPGDNVLVTATINTVGFVSVYYLKGIVVTTPATNTFTFTGLASGVGFIGTFGGGSVSKVEYGRSARMVPVSTLVSYDYALPGVTPGVGDYADVDLPDQFEAIDGDGDLVDTLNGNTYPTAAVYRAMLANREFIVLDAAVRAYKGNILERRIVRGIAP